VWTVFRAEIATRLDADGKGVTSMLRRTSFDGLNGLHAVAGGKGLLPMCRYLVEEARMDVNKRDTATGTDSILNMLIWLFSICSLVVSSSLRLIAPSQQQRSTELFLGFVGSYKVW
jgi:hypothetical protein